MSLTHRRSGGPSGSFVERASLNAENIADLPDEDFNGRNSSGRTTPLHASLLDAENVQDDPTANPSTFEEQGCLTRLWYTMFGLEWQDKVFDRDAPMAPQMCVAHARALVTCGEGTEPPRHRTGDRVGEEARAPAVRACASLCSRCATGDRSGEGARAPAVRARASFCSRCTETEERHWRTRRRDGGDDNDSITPRILRRRGTTSTTSGCMPTTPASASATASRASR
jgi:hypothetical protein